jgi:HprK-related kinase A
MAITLDTLSDLALQRQLAQGLTLVTGPFRFRLQSTCPGVLKGLRILYGAFPFEADSGFRDYHVRIARVRGLRTWFKPQVDFWYDSTTPFQPLPADHDFALLEWGMNWCIASHAHHYLLLHAAVLERNDQAIILPGEPGAGKSTLTAALSLSGWRLLSDELTLIDRTDGSIAPLARPISLKNQSIDIIRAFDSNAVIGTAAKDTHKGTVAHLKPPDDSVARMSRHARARHIVFPRWRAGAETRLSVHSKADAFMHAANHAFNYSVLGRSGFELNADLIDTCDCWDFEYARLDEAMRVFERLVQ